MKPVVIENPFLNSPFEMPRRHFKFDDDGISNEMEERRRPSSYLLPIANPKERKMQHAFDTQGDSNIPTILQEKPGESSTGGAESGALSEDWAFTDQQLARVVAAWPQLPDAIRRPMLALIESTNAT
jgi:hypothetical protein